MRCCRPLTTWPATRHLRRDRRRERVEICDPPVPVGPTVLLGSSPSATNPGAIPLIDLGMTPRRTTSITLARYSRANWRFSRSLGVSEGTVKKRLGTVYVFGVRQAARWRDPRPVVRLLTTAVGQAYGREMRNIDSLVDIIRRVHGFDRADRAKSLIQDDARCPRPGSAAGRHRRAGLARDSRSQDHVVHRRRDRALRGVLRRGAARCGVCRRRLASRSTGEDRVHRQRRQREGAHRRPDFMPVIEHDARDNLRPRRRGSS